MGPDAKMLGIDTPERLAEQQLRADPEWQKEFPLGDDRFTLFCLVQKEMVGVGSAGIIHMPKIGVCWYMHSGYVQEKFQRMGIGKKLFAGRLNEIIKRGGGRVIIAVKRDNYRSIQLAVSFGFEKLDDDYSKEGFYMALENVNDEEVIKKIKDVLNER